MGEPDNPDREIGGDWSNILEFLMKWRTREEVKERFGLSHTQAYNLFNRLLKGRRPLAESMKVRIAGKRNRVWLYKAIEYED